MSENERKSRPRFEYSEKVFRLMSTNALLTALDTNKSIPITKKHIRTEILRRMKEGFRG